MLYLINKISFLNINEYWFVLEEQKLTNCLFSLKIFRGARVNKNSFFCQKEVKYTLITNLMESKEKIFKKFTSNLRNEIRKVEKMENLAIEYNKIKKNDFINFYNEFAEHKNLPYLNNRRLEKYQDNLFFVSAKLDDKLTNIQVYLVDKDSKITRLLYSVSSIHGLDDKTKRNQIGWINKALHWKSICYFIDLEFEVFDWGGYGNDDGNKELVGIDKFKKSFGGELLEVYDYYSFLIYILLKIKEFKY